LIMVEQKVNGTAGNNLDGLRPSSVRRQRLRHSADPGTLPTVSNFFPLERYFDASEKLFKAFESAYDDRRLDEAFVFGLRYCTFCMDGLVHHDYYEAKKFEAPRVRSKKRLAEIVTKLEHVAEWMDAEEIAKEEKRQALIKQQQEERLRKQQELEQKRIEELQKRIEEQKRSSSDVSPESLEESAFAKLQRLSQSQVVPQRPLPSEKQSMDTLDQNKKVTWNLPAEPDGRLLSQVSSDSGDLPPPLLPPPDNGENIAPPSYNSILKQSSYFGPGSRSSSSSSMEPEQSCAPSYDQVAKMSKTKPKAPKLPPIRQLISQTAAKHREFLQQGRIQVSPLNTYQGRISGSTNGCTVISACVVSKHMETHGGVTDAQVSSIIDRECVPLLRAIRNKLDLGAASLIIPSDVHDYLVDHKLLYQHKFVGATGGNFVNPVHAGELIKLLQGEPGKTSHLKAGATLFFREHVVSIVKFPKSANDAVYDMIDSLPTCNGRGSRTRCHSLDALKVHLGWYCTRKFSDSNITYIERNKWDDAMADFDPRVFQAFVWADLPEPKSN